MTENHNLTALKQELESKLAIYTEQLHNNETCNLSELNATLSALYKLKQIQATTILQPLPAHPHQPSKMDCIIQEKNKSNAAVGDLKEPEPEPVAQPMLQFPNGSRIPANRGYGHTAKVARGNGKYSNEKVNVQPVQEPVQQSVQQTQPAVDVWEDNVPDPRTVEQQYPSRQDYQQPYEVPNHNQLTKDQLRSTESMPEPQPVQEVVQLTEPEVPLSPTRVEPPMAAPNYQQPMGQQYYGQQNIPIVKRVVIRQSTMMDPVEQMMHDILSAAGVPPAMMPPTMQPPLPQQIPGYGNLPPQYYR